MTNNDTIVAISTQVGISAISIVRLSGEDALNIAKKLTKSTNLTPRYAHLKYIYNDEKVIDRSIVIYFKAPHSFNGEDIIEFQCHGGIITPKSIVELCINNGARLANAGEFSKRAVLNGKMPITTIESIARLITTQSKQTQEIIGRILKGDLNRYIEGLRKHLIEILAHIEVNIDYAQEDLPLDIKEQITSRLEIILQELNEIHKHSLTFQNTIDGHRLSIIGKPNAGKSSILNKLVLKQRAIVSDIAGTTRDTIEESITINDQIIKVIDTAGIHASNDKIEQIGINKTLQAIEDSTIIVAVFDGSLDEDNGDIINLLKNAKDKIIICVINKNDKESKINLKDLECFECIYLCALDDSVYLLRETIARKIESSVINNQEIILSTKRQIDYVKECMRYIKAIKENLDEFEIAAYNISYALKAIDALSKPFDNEEMLDCMFSEFCLGK